MTREQEDLLRQHIALSKIVQAICGQLTGDYFNTVREFAVAQQHLAEIAIGKVHDQPED
jgi:hypothetical protein